MVKPEHLKLLEELPKTAYGKALAAYLDDELSSIDTVAGAKNAKLEELIGRELAVDLINKIFYFLGRRNPQVAKKKVNYT